MKKTICILLTFVLTFSMMSLFSVAAEPLAYENALITDGNIIDNVLSLDMYRYGSIEHSYLQPNADGTFSRITSNGEDVCIDNYTAEFKYIDSKKIEAPLPIFGGFYSGSEYNFFLFGQKNLQESDSVEVFRIVKFTKDWKKVGSVSLKGANTRTPFLAGSARMFESNGTLFVHTCHEMYETDDGKHHQANVQIYVDINTMNIIYNYYDIMNIGYCGYCSHSFDQYIRSDGEYVYAVDHGDAHLRSVTICKKQQSGEMINYTEALKIYGTSGDNTTGVSLGGFEISDSTLIIAGNTSSQKAGQNTNLRNIFVTVTDKNFNSTKFVQLTDYDQAGKISKPELVKVASNKFIVMWNEFDTTNYNYNFTCMKAVMIDAQGNVLEKIETDAKVSDCQPVIVNSKMIWYANNTFYSFDINKFSEYDSYTSVKTFGNYEYIKTTDGVIITGYKEDDSYIRIPSEIDGAPVVSIGDGAFKNKNITYLVLPETLKKIGNYAFYECKILKYIFVPDGVTHVGEYAFAFCYDVAYLALPKSVKSIGTYGFFTFSLDDIYYQGSEADWNKLDTFGVFCADAKKTMHYNSNLDYYHFDFGDVNLDDAFSSKDALVVLQHSTGLKKMTADELRRADVSKDGKINSSDALLLLQRATGIITHF